MNISHWLGPNRKKARELDIFETSADELLLCDGSVPIPEKRIVYKKKSSNRFSKPTCPSCWTCPQPCHGNPRQASGSTLGSLWVVVLEKLCNSTHVRWKMVHLVFFVVPILPLIQPLTRSSLLRQCCHCRPCRTSGTSDATSPRDSRWKSCGSPWEQ